MENVNGNTIIAFLSPVCSSAFFLNIVSKARVKYDPGEGGKSLLTNGSDTTGSHGTELTSSITVVLRRILRNGMETSRKKTQNVEGKILGIEAPDIGCSTWISVTKRNNAGRNT